MARMFYNHKPQDIGVERTVNHENVFWVSKSCLQNAGIDTNRLADVCAYVCVASEGHIWAALSMYVTAGGLNVIMKTIKMEDQPCVQEMLLADLILN